MPHDDAGATSTPVYAVVGCLTTDSVITATGRLIGPTCGGNALYAVAGTHVWDQRVGIVTRAGADYPETCLAELAAAVDASGLRRLPGPHPIHVAFAYQGDGSRERTIPPAVLDAIAPDVRPFFVDTTRDAARYVSGTPTAQDIPATWLTDVPAVHLPSLLVESHRELIEALRAAQPDRLITADSPWYERRETSTTAHLDLLAEVDVVLPSEHDLGLLEPGVSTLDAARWLIEAGARAVVVKLGPDGSVVVDGRGRMTHIPAYPAQANDPTGAGDAFCGGFLAGFRETGDLVQAAAFGTVSASFAVEALSAFPVFGIDRAAAEERLERVIMTIDRGIVTDPRRKPA